MSLYHITMDLKGSNLDVTQVWTLRFSGGLIKYWTNLLWIKFFLFLNTWSWFSSSWTNNYNMQGFVFTSTCTKLVLIEVWNPWTTPNTEQVSFLRHFTWPWLQPPSVVACLWVFWPSVFIFSEKHTQLGWDHVNEINMNLKELASATHFSSLLFCIVKHYTMTSTAQSHLTEFQCKIYFYSISMNKHQLDFSGSMIRPLSPPYLTDASFFSILFSYHHSSKRLALSVQRVLFQNFPGFCLKLGNLSWNSQWPFCSWVLHPARWLDVGKKKIFKNKRSQTL